MRGQEEGARLAREAAVAAEQMAAQQAAALAIENRERAAERQELVRAPPILIEDVQVLA